MVLSHSNIKEKAFVYGLLACAAFSVLVTVAIVFSVLFESIKFFSEISVFDALTGLTWTPTSIDSENPSASFGLIPLFVGTCLIMFIAMSVAVPLGVTSAIYISEYSSARFRAYAKPVLEILAGIPTVVYGYFAITTISPLIMGLGESLGLSPSSESALTAGLVMGVMIIPFVSSLSDDVISAVPNALREASYGLGANKSETIKSVVLPAAMPGIVSAVLLAVSRAIGETMIVVMAAGSMAKLSVNPFDAVTTFTVQIVTLLTGDQEFDSVKTMAAFALGLTLFVATLALNFYALKIVKKYREKYE